MAWWRSLFAEILPAWHERRLVGGRETDNDDTTALHRFRRRIAMGDQKQPARDVRDDPAPNPVVPARGQKPPIEIPPGAEHVPVRTPDKDPNPSDVVPKSAGEP